MITKTENCLYCGEKMESKTAKKKFCSTKCRIYYNRELARGTLIIAKVGENISDVAYLHDIKNVTVNKRKQHNHSLTLTVSPENKEIPRLKGEDSISYRLRMIEENKK